MYQLLQLYDTFCKAVDNGKEVRVVFFFFFFFFFLILQKRLTGSGIRG